jgi:hypothetical protein
MKLRAIAFVMLVSPSGCAKESAFPKIEPVATVLELHETMISPASDVIFNVGLEPPKDDGAWKAVRNNALILAEAGNLLMTEGRAKDQGPWMDVEGHGPWRGARENGS